MKLINPHGRTVTVTESMHRRYSNKKGWRQVAFEPKAVGGGFYELSNGDRVQGKQAAIEAQEKING